MKVFRTFIYDEKQSDIEDKGGSLYVPKEYQGSGRHDISGEGIFYCALERISAVAERLQSFRCHKLDNEDFKRRGGMVVALVKYELDSNNIIDLRAPGQLKKINALPSQIATHDRKITQSLAKAIYAKGWDGLLWWSAIEAKWSNASLFSSRIKDKIKVAGEIEILSIEHQTVKEAAKMINIIIG